MSGQHPTFTEYETQHLLVLNRIAVALETIAMSNAPAPAFVKPLSEYRSFDWSAIGASVSASDTYGPTEIDWGGYTWKRRSPSNNFSEAIYYSRPIGKKQDGSNNYARLITFKDMGSVKPISREAEAAIGQKPEKPTPKPAPPAEPIARSELEEYLGPNPRTAPDVILQAAPLKTEADFIAWLAQRGWNGKEVYSALGTDAKSWIRLNPGKGWADVAQTIAATLGK